MHRAHGTVRSQIELVGISPDNTAFLRTTRAVQVCKTKIKRPGFGLRYRVTTCGPEQSCLERNQRCAESIDGQQKAATAGLKQALSPWHTTKVKPVAKGNSSTWCVHLAQPLIGRSVATHISEDIRTHSQILFCADVGKLIVGKPIVSRNTRISRKVGTPRVARLACFTCCVHPQCPQCSWRPSLAWQSIVFSMLSTSPCTKTGAGAGASLMGLGDGCRHPG